MWFTNRFSLVYDVLAESSICWQWMRGNYATYLIRRKLTEVYAAFYHWHYTFCIFELDTRYKYETRLDHIEFKSSILIRFFWCISRPHKLSHHENYVEWHKSMAEPHSFRCVFLGTFKWQFINSTCHVVYFTHNGFIKWTPINYTQKQF